MRTTIMLALGCTLLGTATPALAKKHHHEGAARHCRLHAAAVPQSKKECITAGGTWEKGAFAAQPTPAAAKK